LQCYAHVKAALQMAAAVLHGTGQQEYGGEHNLSQRSRLLQCYVHIVTRYEITDVSQQPILKKRDRTFSEELW
jgi:hypothetical protein